MYDIRFNDTTDSCGMNWPDSVHNMTRYMNRPDVHQALNVPESNAPERWVECNNGVQSHLRGDTSSPASQKLPSVIKSIPVMLFVGDQDLVCNYIGIEWMIGNMTWNNQKGFTSNKGMQWLLDGEDTGLIMSERNLTYIKIYNSSHMSGVDHPMAMLDLLTRLTNASRDNLGFQSALQEVDLDLATASRTMAVKSLDTNAGKSLSEKDDDDASGGSSGHGLLLLLLLVAVVALALLGWWYRSRIKRWWVSYRYKGRGVFSAIDRNGNDDGLTGVRETFGATAGGSRRHSLDNSSVGHELEIMGNHHTQRGFQTASMLAPPQTSTQFSLYDPNDPEDFTDSDSELALGPRHDHGQSRPDAQGMVIGARSRDNVGWPKADPQEVDLVMPDRATLYFSYKLDPFAPL
ncbi:Cell death protease [Spiromyces aspiralis]|uniref:Cell death protease n=1 Tax=Spiromyces aspiralis TaxID=68401 RepID=A0ACC1HQG4_9FUNG|nr:Cell death protease [Spiromyces aspiralis]